MPLRGRIYNCLIDYKTHIVLMTFLFCLLPANIVALPENQTQPTPILLTSQGVVQELGWVPSKKQSCHFCDGYFFQPAALAAYPNPLPANELETEVDTKGAAQLRSDGVSVLTGGVVLTQLGRRITADTALLSRDAKLGKVTLITLIGHVHLQQYNRLVVSDYAQFDLIHNTILLKNALYHFGPTPFSKQTNSKKQSQPDSISNFKFDAWGHAASIHNPTQDVIHLTNASYSTCAPLNRVWMISAKQLHLDRNHGVGTAKHAVFHIKKMPVAYIPYFRFPIDNRRLTGFLMPTFSSSSTQGVRIGLPFYWNMAPNYDDTFTPAYNDQRGAQLQNVFRYLTQNGQGIFNIAYTPDDTEFGSYRNEMISEYSNNPLLAPYVDQLNDMSNDRAFVGFNGTQQWDEAWNSDFDLNYVTDPYFFRDNTVQMQSNPLEQNALSQTNQLLNQVSLNYAGTYWNFSSLLQGYQTLHQIDEFASPVYDQYQRLPELDASAFYPDIWHDLNWNLTSQAVNFQINNIFPTQNNTLPTPVGQRFQVRPSVDYNATWEGGYIDPELYVDDTSYVTQFEQTSQSSTRPDFNQSRVIPIADIDMGLYFDRSFTLDHTNYLQTLEPRLFYLWVPYENQNDYPVFDTQLLPFSFAQLFSVNSFSGVDRIQNANQVSFGLSSKILNSDTDTQKLEFDLGAIYYMQNPEVTLPGTVLSDETFSPIVGSLTYNITPAWSTSMSAAWDAEQKAFNNAGADITYNVTHNRIFDFGYQFVSAAGTNLVGISNNTNNIHAGFTWPLFYRWTGFAYAQYVFSGDYPGNYFAGIQYDACCWALRFIFDRQFIGYSPSSTVGNVTNEFDNTYYVQLQLKGLAGVGDNGSSGLLQDSLPGYRDPFLGENV